MHLPKHCTLFRRIRWHEGCSCRAGIFFMRGWGGAMHILRSGNLHKVGGSPKKCGKCRRKSGSVFLPVRGQREDLLTFFKKIVIKKCVAFTNVS